GRISSRATEITLGGPVSCARTAEADNATTVPRMERRRSMGDLLFGEMYRPRYACPRGLSNGSGRARLPDDARPRHEPPRPAHREEQHAADAFAEVGAAVQGELARPRPGDREPHEPDERESEPQEGEGGLGPARPAADEERAEARQHEEVRHQARPRPRLVLALGQHRAAIVDSAACPPTPARRSS